MFTGSIVAIVTPFRKGRVDERAAFRLGWLSRRCPRGRAWRPGHPYPVRPSGAADYGS